MKESFQLRHMNYEINDLLIDRYNFISYDDNIRISALNNACVILRTLCLINDSNLRCYIAEAIRDNDIFKLTKMISSISGEG